MAGGPGAELAARALGQCCCLQLCGTVQQEAATFWWSDALSQGEISDPLAARLTPPAEQGGSRVDLPNSGVFDRRSRQSLVDTSTSVMCSMETLN